MDSPPNLKSQTLPLTFRQVELAVGKSNMLGMFEVEFDGISVRTLRVHVPEGVHWF